MNSLGSMAPGTERAGAAPGSQSGQATWQDALAAAGVSLCHVDPFGVIHFDEDVQARFGVPPRSRLRTLIRWVARSCRRDLLAAIRGIRNFSQQHSFELMIEAPWGESFWVRLLMRRHSDHCDGDCALGTILDITTDRQRFEVLAQSEEHLRYTVELNPQLPWIADAQGKILDVTDRWLDATGMTRDCALGAGWFSVTHPDDMPAVIDQITFSLSSGAPFDVRMRLCVHGEYRWMRARGFARRDERGNIFRWYGYTEDIHEHVLVENQIRWNAEHDPLTGLANRALLNARLEAALSQSLQNLSRVGILLLDLDHFKDVNDLLGHHAGDQLLKSYADQLRAFLPESSLVARLGGDEFAVLFDSLSSRGELVEWGERLCTLRADAGPMQASLECRASLGAAIYPDHGQTSSELMRHADIALYAAKERGRGQLLLFEPRMQDDVREHAAMISRARTAAQSGDILAYYQPKVSLATGALVGFEALLRWRDAKGQIHAPGSIHAAFEEPEVADMLGRAMLEHVIRDIQSWQRQGLSFGHVAINVAPAEFRCDKFAPRLIELMGAAGLAHDTVEVEITEGVILGRGADHALESINYLSEQGFPIVLDDFGTGFASLSHLRALPVDTLKIDRSFVSHIAAENGDAAIVSAIVNLGGALGIKVVAEGIETQAQADVLRSFGCEFAQGYFFGMPTPALQIPRLIAGWDAGTGSYAASRQAAR